MATSNLSRLECRMLPPRNFDSGVLAIYDGFFASTILSGGNLFLTGDGRLSRWTEIPIEIF